MKKDDIIFFSASVPYRKGWKDGARPTEIEEAIVSLARAVFAHGGRLLFGGHPSVSPLVSAIAGEYYPVDPLRIFRPVVTFQSEFFRAKLPNETWEMFRMGFSAIEWTANMGERSPSLKLMREWMLLSPDLPEPVRDRNRLTPPRLMVAIGGMDGVRDEATLFLRNQKHWDVPSPPPVVAVTSGGGAARRLMEPIPRLREALWMEEPVREDDQALFEASRDNGSLFSLEDGWRKSHGMQVSSTDGFEPYASMMQWLISTV